MNDRQLSLFISVVEQGSFNKAEISEHMSRQGIIAQINALENEVGVPLLQRTSHGVQLTPAGIEFYQGIRHMLSDYHALLAKVRARDEAPRLRLASVEHHVLLQPIAGRFHTLYPHVDIVSSLFPCYDELALVRENRIDVGEAPCSHSRSLQGLGYIPIYDAPYLCVMRPDHPLAGCGELSLGKLSGHPLVLSENQERCLYSHAMMDALAAAGLQVSLIRSSRHLHKAELVFDICDRGDIYLSPSPFLQRLTDYAVLPLAEPFRMEYGVVFRRNPPSPVKDFLDIASSYYRQ